MPTLPELIQNSFEDVHDELLRLQKQIDRLHEEKNRMILVGECIRVEGDRCELGFGKVDGTYRQVSGLVPWLDRASDDFQTYLPPSIGEQGLLLNFGSADTLRSGVAIFGIRSNENPMPSDNSNTRQVIFKDSFEISADRDNKQVTMKVIADDLILMSGSQITLDSREVKVTGKLTADDIASNTEVTDSTSTMQAMRDLYNSHNHSNQGAAPPTQRM